MITSITTQARKDPNYRNIYLFEREFFASSNRFILKNASNKISKHIIGGIEGKVADHLIYFSKKSPFIDPSEKRISVPTLKTTSM